ncbi:hypothetical protein [Magnetococcus sp. PR-3]|uniref:hypothetical protein n=1 Tax=Magnetococcus sp. PR-3 TaxID=3120355 RepID=UPI002FCE479E
MFLNSGLHIDQAPPLHIPFRFFATAPIFMALTGIALLFYGADLQEDNLDPIGIAMVHGIMLGWLNMVMWGAMYQMIPVLAGIRVAAMSLAHFSHAFLVAGLLCLMLGLPDLFEWRDHLLLAASILLPSAFLLFILPVGWALWHAPSKHPTVHTMRLALLGLTITMLLGLIFLLEHQLEFLPLDRQQMVAIHAAWALLGWVGLLVIGVSFQVLPMFYMMEAFPTDQARRITTLWLTTPVALTVALLLGGDWQLGLLALVPLYAAVALYALKITPLILHRKRQIMDGTLRFWLLGFLCGALSLLALPIWLIGDRNELMVPLFTLFSVGFAGSIILGMLYKIIPFLVWFHRFSRLAGLAAIPTMEDLVPDRLARAHVWLQAAAVTCLTAGWYLPGGLLLLLSGGGILAALWHALKHPIPEVPAATGMEDFAKMFENMPKPDGS